MDEHVPVSLAILREHGSMSLARLTAETAMRMNCTQLYVNVDAVMRGCEKRGQARCDADDYNYTFDVWKAL